MASRFPRDSSTKTLNLSLVHRDTEATTTGYRPSAPHASASGPGSALKLLASGIWILDAPSLSQRPRSPEAFYASGLARRQLNLLALGSGMTSLTPLSAPHFDPFNLCHIAHSWFSTIPGARRSGVHLPRPSFARSAFAGRFALLYRHSRSHSCNFYIFVYSR